MTKTMVSCDITPQLCQSKKVIGCYREQEDDNTLWTATV